MKFAALLAMASLAAAWPAAALRAETSPRLVIVDNDFGVPVSAIQAVPLITSPAVKVLGVTTVVGDSNVTDDVIHTLRFLEIIGRNNIPCRGC